MKQTTAEATDKIMAILSDKGQAIMQADLDEIELLLTRVDLDDIADVEPMVYEGLALTVNDPLYEGDIEPIT